MDTRKPIGQRAERLQQIFDDLPEARLRFDVAHASSVDSSMREGERIPEYFGARLSHAHLSSLDESCRHVALTGGRAWEAGFVRIGQNRAVVHIPVDAGRFPADSAPIGQVGAEPAAPFSP
jgi:hypothetical protein